MNIKIKFVEFPIDFIRDVVLKDNKVIVSMLEHRNLEFTFDDNNSAKTEYKKIVNKITNSIKRKIK